MNYFEAVDHAQLCRQYPVADFTDRFRGMSRDELCTLQETRLREVLAFAWRIPFYRRLWGAAGAEPGDIRGLDDLSRLPSYSKSDLMASVEAYPPFGDFHGRDLNDPPLPMILQTTSGTTGRPQPLLWGPQSREIQNMLLARLYLMQGMRRSDVVHSVYGFGMVNGGHYVRETVNHWIGAPILTAGTGAETRSAQQVAMMRDFGATVIVGFGDYIRRLAEVARAAGIEPGRDIRIRLISGHMGAERADALAALWGATQAFDWYGVGDTGAIAGQGPDREGLHVLEDAQLVEIVDPATRAPAAEGGIGDLVCTCLYKRDIFPVIRFNTHDLTRALPGDNPLGLPLRRIAGFLGRSDNMVKLRGINVYPDGIGALLTERFAETTGEFVCRVDHVANDTRMTVVVEVEARPEGLAAAMQEMLRSRLGVQIAVELGAPGETAPLTGIEARQKPIRLIGRAP